ncbi:hypothetical protein EYZ11_010827 [Aspergillus tanneri]|uniref:DUF7704 domain-containing protein n=1 Tax=Aspergillus tanneri TaxID=1220188 RepID=A0A4V3UN42_9EURO|nr:uncharacterized protein ATNIH1004_007131 [Aspergillus tanneri]KAA8645712.1 hypothetical protein ATNIH1004_007131 [Aspergillus tanneri]THC89724.1 hypothetical protein EYZ11_010827 [Aspergillus tanneri]
MRTTILPYWPHLLFAVIEPITYIYGWLLPIHDLNTFILDQAPNTAAPGSIHPSAIVLGYQLANLHGLLCLLSMGVYYYTNEPKILRNFVFCLALGDLGHIYGTYLGLGWDVFCDFHAWNFLTWSNIILTAFLFVNRVLYLCGYFGYAKAARTWVKKKY